MNPKSSKSIGFFGLLTILLIVLKLVEVITWPWVVILMPVWVPSLAVVFFFLIIFLVAFYQGFRDVWNEEWDED